MSIDERLGERQPQIVIAHRTAVLGDHPENTLAWLEAGVERGVDVLHINLQRTADGHYVLMHDPTLNRTTDVESAFPEGPPGGPTREQRAGKDYVGDYTLNEIGQLEIAAGDDGSVHSVPTLSEAIELVDGRALLLLGLKSYDVETLSAVLQRHETQNLEFFELYFSGTDQSQLRELSERTGVPVGVTLYRSTDHVSDLDKVYAQLGPNLKTLHIDSSGFSPDLASRLEALKLHLVLSGRRSGEDHALVARADPGPWRDLLERGYSVSTGQPDAVLELLGR